LRRVISGTSIILLLVGLFGFAVNVQRVRADGTIYIRADGSIDPPKANITSVDNVTYTLTDDIYNMSIEVERDNIVLDGNNHVLQCSGNTRACAIGLWWINHVVVTRVVISGGFTYGIMLVFSSNNDLVSNSITGGVEYGICLQQSDHNTLSNNIVMNTFKAISLEYSNHNNLYDNEALESFYGISILSGTGHELRNNVMAGNKRNFGVIAIWELEEYIHNIGSSNLVDGKPIYYLINRRDFTVPQRAGCVVIVNSDEITVKNLNLRNNDVGITLAYTTNSVIENVTATGNFIPIFLDLSDHNVVNGNNVTNNGGAGIALARSHYNNVTCNYVHDTNGSGIWLEDTYCNTIIGNHVSSSRRGSPQEFDGAGILVDDSYDCEIIDNTVTENEHGIVVGADPAQYNIVARNNIMENNIGFILFDTQRNKIYHNDFLRNAVTVHTYHNTAGSTFYSNYPIGGNYWSNYTSVDLYSGPDQNETGSDGISDTPYIVDGNHQDKYPLMKPFYSFIHDIAVSNVTIPIREIQVGDKLNVNASVLNLGEKVETIGVTVFLNQTAIAEYPIPQILPGNTETFTLECETTGLASGNYSASVYAQLVAGETNTSDNTFVYGEVNLLPDTRPPTVLILSPENRTYNVSLIPLTFEINEQTSWIGYSLDGKSNITITENIVLSGLHDGYHNILIHANDTSGNKGESELIHFTVELVHDVAVNEVITQKTGCLPVETISQGSSLDIFVTIENQGTSTETFNVTVYANSTTIGELQITLIPTENRTIIFTWNTIEVIKGNYSIGATASTVLREIDIIDNTLTYGLVLVTIPGDINGDMDVDLFDIVRICSTYGTSEPEPGFDPNSDLNNNGSIDIFDIVITVKNYMESG